jgi:hypothetical protein
VGNKKGRQLPPSYLSTDSFALFVELEYKELLNKLRNWLSANLCRLEPHLRQRSTHGIAEQLVSRRYDPPGLPVHTPLLVDNELPNHLSFGAR